MLHQLLFQLPLSDNPNPFLNNKVHNFLFGHQNSFEVSFLKYENLHDLIHASNSSRKYFLSLPVDMQMALHTMDQSIHSAADLHLQASMLEKSYFSQHMQD